MAKKTTKKSAKKATKKAPAKKKAAAKRTTTRKKPAAKKATAKKSAVTKKAAKKSPTRKKAAPKKSTAKKAVAKKTVTKKPPAAESGSRRKSAKKNTGLGRPRIPGDAKLELVFQQDYEARQICEYLEVETIRELEKFGPEEIIQRLKAPIVKTVGRIRKILAIANRSLAGDTSFAVEFRKAHFPDET